MQLSTKPVINPNLSPIHHPIQPKTVTPIKIQSLFISYPTRIMPDNNYTIRIKRQTQAVSADLEYLPSSPKIKAKNCLVFTFSAARLS
jgi:hypothetical protein